jgi:outer membrane protein assembly factor BamE (lipoprotein component of BamABCDE complex)
LSCMILFSCGGIGRIPSDEVLSLIKRGKSTKTDVEELLGKPFSSEVIRSGGEIWEYRFIQRRRSHSAYPEYHLLTIQFYTDGIVKDLNRKSMPRPGAGLIQMGH